MVANGHGSTVRESAQNAYKNVKKIDIPDCINVRDDVGERLEKELPILQKAAWVS